MLNISSKLSGRMLDAPTQGRSLVLNVLQCSVLSFSSGTKLMKAIAHWILLDARHHVSTGSHRELKMR